MLLKQICSGGTGALISRRIAFFSWSIRIEVNSFPFLLRIEIQFDFG